LLNLSTIKSYLPSILELVTLDVAQPTCVRELQYSDDGVQFLAEFEPFFPIQTLLLLDWIK
jgi:hypothetical protein